MTRFQDVELLVMDFVTEHFSADVLPTNVGTETPADLQARMPFVLVVRGPGTDDGLTDFPSVDIEVFASTRSVAYALAEDIRARLLEFPHRVNAGGVIDRVRTLIAPRRLPWADENIRRFTATYRISARR